MQVKLKLLIKCVCLFSCKSVTYLFNSQTTGTESKKAEKTFPLPLHSQPVGQASLWPLSGGWTAAAEVLTTCVWRSQNLGQNPFTFVPFSPFSVPESLFCLFSDSEVQGIQAPMLNVSSGKEAHLGTALKNPQTRPSQSSPVFPSDGTLWHPALGQSALITQWVLVDDMRLVCITQLHWYRYPGHHLTGTLGPGLRERNPRCELHSGSEFPLFFLSHPVCKSMLNPCLWSIRKAGEDSLLLRDRTS